MWSIKIQQITVMSIMLFMFSMSGQAQYKEYKLNAKGDTINIINKNGLKQGKWVISVPELRGEPGYEAEGMFKNGKKEGVWRLYSLSGDLIGVENYLFGGKDGTQQYFTYLGDLVREENWKGYNPDAPYDTIPVYGDGNNEIIDHKIVKAEQYSVRDGEWKYYEAGTGHLMKTETYDRGRLVVPGAPPLVTTAKVVEKPKKPDKTPAMLEWEKKNKGKRRVLRDGRTGM